MLMQIDNSKVLIITGNSLGGSVATLFTLWLLETIDFSITKRPLCITFGSPLVGDNGLQNAILKYPTWNSCFLHVVSDQDPFPRVLISPHNPPANESASQTNVYKPFGTFLLYSKSGCGCFEDSQTILELLMATYVEGPENQNPNQVLELYEKIVEYLNRKVICRDTTTLLQWTTPPQCADIINIQLVAIGLMRPQVAQSQLLIKYNYNAYLCYIVYISCYGSQMIYDTPKHCNVKNEMFRTSCFDTLLN